MPKDAATHPTAADRAFEAYCQTGSAEELERLFNLTAPRLILVAMHLARDPAAAEDLVQITFLEAIRNASSFQPGRAVMPWLLTILERRARDLLRRRRQTAELPDVEDRTTPGPVSALTQHETFETVAAKLEQLPEHYRQVLVLRLVHGLTPVEIARALGRPPGTVHAQLHRGLAQLRQILPKGLATAVALVALSGRGLAAVKSCVLAAVQPGTAATTTTLLGGLIMKKWMAVGAMALVLVAFAGWELGNACWLLPSERESNVEESALADDHATTVSRDQRETGDASARSVLEQETDPRFSTVCGRIIAAESGTPLAGATITLTDTRWAADGQRVSGEWRDPEPAVTAPDGRFHISVVRPKSTDLDLHIAAPGRMPLSTSCYMNLKPGAVMDHGDVPMPLGSSVALKVVDDQDQPVGDYWVGLRADRPSRGRGRYGLIVPRDAPPQERTDAMGLRPAVLLGPGRWMVVEDSQDWRRFVGPQDFLVRADDPPRVVTLRLRCPDPDTTAAGRVVDASGAPMPGFELGATRPTYGIRATRTDKNGDFALSGLPGGELSLVLMGRQRRFRLDGNQRVRRGTENNVVVVRRVAKVAVTIVVKDESGIPVQKFAHRAVPVSFQHGIADTPWLGPQQQHTGGMTTLQLYPGHYMLTLRPADPRLAWVLGQGFEILEDTETTIPVVVPRWRHWQVRVLDQRRQPVKGTQVEVVRGLGGGSLSDAIPVEDMFTAKWGWLSVAVITATATTDKNGIAGLRTAPELGHAGLQLNGTKHQPKLVEGLSIPSHGRPLEVLVEAAARVHGRVAPQGVARDWGGPRSLVEAARLLEGETAEDIRSEYPAILLVDPSNGREVVPSTTIGQDGSFHLGPVPTGTWNVVLELSISTDGTSGSIRRTPPLARIADLRAGEERDVTVDASHLVKRTLRGLAQLDGAPALAERLALRNGLAMFHAAIRKDGTFTLQAIPGDYVAYLDLGGSLPRRQCYCTRIVHVGPQAEQVLNLSFTKRRLRLRLLMGPDDTPVADAFLWLEPAPEAHVLLRRTRPSCWGNTDADGWVTFDPAPAFPVSVQLRRAPPRAGIQLLETGPDGKYRSLGVVRLPDGAPEHQQVIRIRAR